MKPRILIYMNSHVAYHLDKSVMKKFINNKIGNKNWEFFGDVLVPNLFKNAPDEYLTEDFFHGVATHQYTMIQKGGTFINPMLYGLHNDFAVWNEILHGEPDFFQEVLYIDVPYDVYHEAAKDNDEYYVDETRYNDMSTTIDVMVEKMKETFYLTGNELH